MKIAVCAQSNGLEAKVDNRFGRCNTYVLVDTEKNTVTNINNEAKDQASGAGGQAVRLLNTHNVDVIICPELGPKAIKALYAFEIQAYAMDNSETVGQAIDAFITGKLALSENASVQAHSGLRKA